MNRYLTILLLILCAWPLTSQAILVPGLHEAEVPIADQSDQSRLQGIRTALEMVLVKLTGDRYAAGRKALSPLLQRAETYVQEYRYRQPATKTEADEPQLLLSVRFNKDSLEQSLRDLSVPVWPKERPTTLLWLVVKEGLNRQMIGLDNGSAYIKTIDNRTELRGLALLYPLLDLEDNARLRPGDVWGNFQQPVLDASSRYSADSILTGSIESPVPGIWEGRWTAYIDNQVYDWVTQGDIVEVVLDEGIDGMADRLSAQFAPMDSIREDLVRIAIADINTVNQYAAVLKYFESFNSVTDVKVEHVETGQVIFLLTAHGGSLAVSQAITLGRLLEPISGSRGMAYRLLP